jgi:hypothetical protein
MQLNLRIKDTLWGHYISLLTYFCHVCPLTILKFKWNFISERLHEEEKINQTSSSFEGHSRYYFTVVLVFEESTVGGSTVLVLLDRKQSTCMHNQLLSAHFVVAIFQISQQTYPLHEVNLFWRTFTFLSCWLHANLHYWLHANLHYWLHANLHYWLHANLHYWLHANLHYWLHANLHYVKMFSDTCINLYKSSLPFPQRTDCFQDMTGSPQCASERRIL